MTPETITQIMRTLDSPSGETFSVPEPFRYIFASAFLDGGPGALLKAIRESGLTVDAFHSNDASPIAHEELRHLNQGPLMMLSITGLADVGGYDILVALTDDGRFSRADLNRLAGMLLANAPALRDRDLFPMRAFSGDAGVVVGCVYYPDIRTFAFVGDVGDAATLH